MPNLRGEDEINARRGIVRELFRRARKNYPRLPVIVKGLNDLYQADIIVLNKYASVNNSFKYILLVINCFSKKLFAEKLKTRSAADVTTGMEKILKRVPPFKLLQTDEEKSFYSRQFRSMLNSHGVKLYSTFSMLKASVIERAIRTYKSKLFQRMYFLGKFNWVSIYQSVVDELNNSYHRTIKGKPIDVTSESESHLLNTVYKIKTGTHLKQKFKIGSIVRVSLYRSIFAKKTHGPGWSTKLFRVKAFKSTFPHSYKLENLDHSPVQGTFLEHEMQLTKFPDEYLVEKVLRKKKDKVFVKFLNLPSSENCWIDK